MSNSITTAPPEPVSPPGQVPVPLDTTVRQPELQRSLVTVATQTEKPAFVTFRPYKGQLSGALSSNQHLAGKKVTRRNERTKQAPPAPAHPPQHLAYICPLLPPTTVGTDVPSLGGKVGGLSGEVVVVGLATGGRYAAGEVLSYTRFWNKPQNEDHPVGESEQMNREVRSADSSVDPCPTRSL